MSQRRVPLIGALLGLVLLLVVAAFAIGLPKVEGAESEDVDVSDALPDALPDTDDLGPLAGLPASEELAASQAGEEAADGVREQLGSAEDNLSGALDAPVAVRAYADEGGTVSAVLVAVGAEGDVALPQQLPIDADLLQLAQAPVEVTRDGDAVCSAYFQPVPQGSETSDAPPEPAAVVCQLAADGRTFAVQVQGQGGFDVSEAADLLRAVAA